MDICVVVQVDVQGGFQFCFYFCSLQYGFLVEVCVVVFVVKCFQVCVFIDQIVCQIDDEGGYFVVFGFGEGFVFVDLVQVVYKVDL